MEIYLDKGTDTSKLSVDDINNLLIDKMRDYLQMNQKTELEVKPEEFDNTDTTTTKHTTNIDDELEELNITSEVKLDRQFYNIANNIVLSYFSLPDSKFMAILERINAWGLELTLKEFILNYYIYNKLNKYLKQFILMHFDKLLSIVCKLIEKQLISKFNLYNFDSENNTLDTLKQSLTEKEKELQKVDPSNVIIDRNKNITDIDTIAQLKLDVLNDLKKEHPELEN